ncbi:MAG: Inosose isomerase, partial [uncultured Quadrisphaera sp.]
GPTRHPVHRPVGRPAVRGGRAPGRRLGLRRPGDRVLGRPPRPLARRRGRRVHRAEEGRARAARAAGVRHRQPPQGPGGVRRPDRRAPPRDRLRPGVGRRRPRGGAGAGGRGDGVDGAHRGPPRGAHGHRVHGQLDLEVRRHVPAGHPGDGRRRVRRLRRPVEPGARRLRRGGGPLRPRGAPERDRLRLLDHPADARGDRAPPGVRAQLGPQPLRLAGPRPRRVPVGLPRADLPRALQGLPPPGRQRAQRAPRLAPAVGRPPPGVGLRLGGARRRPVGAGVPDAQHHRLRRAAVGGVGGRGHGPAGGRAGGAGVRALARLRPAGGGLRRGVRRPL